MPSAKIAAAPSKPTYAVMVTESMKALGNRTASSVTAIKKQVAMLYNIQVDKINQKALTSAIKKGVEAGDLVQIKASYKLGKKPATLKKPPVKKVAKTTLKKKTTTSKKLSPKLKTSIAKKSSKTGAKSKSMKPKKSITKKITKSKTSKSKTSKAKTASKK